MNLKKNEKILLIVLGVVVIIFLFDMFILSDDEPKEAQKLSRIENIEDKAEHKISSAGEMLKLSFQPSTNLISNDLTIDPKLISEWDRDPFLGAFTSALIDSLQHREKDEFVLKAISWRGNIAYVIINDDVYREGESKNGIHVQDVLKDHVIITYNGKRSILRFGE